MPYPDSPTVDEINNHPQLKRELFEAFNTKAKTGIERIKDICNKNGLDDTETRKQMAKFFFENNKNLDPSGVGEYLSGPDTESQEVLRNFTGHLAPSLKDKEFVPALREYFGNIKPPGEAQRLDRVINSFSDAYLPQNPGCGIADNKASLILSFQAIMLATDAHNPAIAEKNKMTYEALKVNLRGYNNGEDFSEDLLTPYYSDLTSRPLLPNQQTVDSAYELKSAQLKTDPTLAGLHKSLGKKQLDVQQTMGLEGLTASVEQRKPFFGGLTGYTAKMTVTDEHGKQATVEIKKPGFFSKKEPVITIKPNDSSPGSLQLAAQLSNRFNTPATARATYEYQREDMTQLLQQKKSGAKLEPEESKVKLSRGGQRDLRQSGFEVVDESQQKPKVKANVEVKEVMKELKLSLESRKSKQEDLGDDEHNVSSKTGLTKVAESKPGESKDIGKGVHRKSGNW